MTDQTEPLVLDLVEWVVEHPRPYSDVMDAWRTSCPRLTIWEDTVDRGYVPRAYQAETGVMVSVTDQGRLFLMAHGRA